MGLSYKELRLMFKESDEKRDAGLKTPENIVRIDNLVYGADKDVNVMDIYYPKTADGSIPAIVSIHGGGWVSGDKDRYQYYCMNLAQKGFAVINFNYHLAPEYKFPAPLFDIADLFRWLKKNSEEYSIDINNLFLAADSAGVQIACHYLACKNSRDLASRIGIDITDTDIKAAAFNCGVYDAAHHMETASKDDPIFLYAGESERDLFDYMQYIDNTFPPSYIATSCEDFLYANAEPMCSRLRNKGAVCEMKVYGEKGDKEIGHVFHLKIRNPVAQACNSEECRFFQKYIEK